MTASTKLRTMAAADATLQGFFGTSPFRWDYIQLVPSARPDSNGQFPCRARYRQVSQVPIYTQEGQNRLNEVRFQIDVLCSDVTVADAATAAIAAWIGTVSFCDLTLTPGQYPNFVMNVRPGLEVQLKPPVPVNSLDVKVFNLDLI